MIKKFITKFILSFDETIRIDDFVIIGERSKNTYKVERVFEDKIRVRKPYTLKEFNVLKRDVTKLNLLRWVSLLFSKLIS